MKLPRLVLLLGYCGLIPFFVGPAWLSFAPESAPPDLDQAWLLYGAMIASFMAGTFWGLALVVIENPAGIAGLIIAAILMLLAWLALLMPFSYSLWTLALVFVLLGVAELWRERTLDPMGTYLRLRLVLTAGVLVALGWRLLLDVGVTFPVA